MKNNGEYIRKNAAPIIDEIHIWMMAQRDLVPEEEITKALRRLFAKRTGQAPIEYLIERRTQLAAELVLQGVIAWLE